MYTNEIICVFSPPLKVVFHLLSHLKVNVWYAVIKIKVIGLFFFCELNIKNNVFLDMLKNYVMPWIEEDSDLIFQLDDATLYFSCIVHEG
jgi:hypothetical protein